ncbi:MAG: transcription termination/antitermination protein NusG, partial [Roseomonas sp.]|nr:transcription termination/antitermination protein NusG [Roseomonas sp.]
MAEKKWYVVHVYSGFERKIAEQIKQQAAQKG